MHYLTQALLALADLQQSFWTSNTSTNGAISVQNCSTDLPAVNLGYAIHQPSFHNISGQYYNFSNIRYAAPPLGNLRFNRPQPPLSSLSDGIQDGSVGYNCPQSMAAWVVSMDEYGNPLNRTGNITYEIPPHGKDESEDCLFLDVVVPQDVLPNCHIEGQHNGKKGAPVLVWIYGGAFIMGSKSYYGNPSGLLAHNKQAGREEMVFVSLNYRLGAFGFLAGPSVQASGTANAGLYDQRMALEWVQKYIHLFGGDPERVTVMGESAGGGSILTHITAYGGREPAQKAPFSQAIIQSPGMIPVVGNYEPESSYKEFIDALNVTSLEGARQLSSEALIRANDQVVSNSVFGKFKFGPTFDAEYIPDLQGRLLQKGAFDHGLKVILGHCSNEGHQFTPDVTTDSEFQSFLTSFFPLADPSIVSHITKTLYPPIYDGSYPYEDMRGRIDLLISEYTFTCNTRHLAQAFRNETYNYRYNNTLGLHTEDVGPTFMNGDESWGWEEVERGNKTHAVWLQEYITSFVTNGSPNSEKNLVGAPQWPIYGEEAKMLDFDMSRAAVLKDDTANERCDWWQYGLVM